MMIHGNKMRASHQKAAGSCLHDMQGQATAREGRIVLNESSEVGAAVLLAVWSKPASGNLTTWLILVYTCKNWNILRTSWVLRCYRRTPYEIQGKSYISVHTVIFFWPKVYSMVIVIRITHNARSKSQYENFTLSIYLYILSTCLYILLQPIFCHD